MMFYTVYLDMKLQKFPYGSQIGDSFQLELTWILIHTTGSLPNRVRLLRGRFLRLQSQPTNPAPNPNPPNRR